MTWLERRPKQEVRTMEAAMQWVLRLRDEGLTEADLADWLRWYEADERNKRVFDEMQAFWQQTGGLASGPGGAERLANLRTVATPSAQARGDGRRILTALAASVALAIGAFLLWPHSAHEVKQRTIAAAPPTVRETQLPDGSRVQLAAKSSVAVDFTPQQRLLELEDGEAYFSVAPDPRKPFIVKVGKLRVRAVGTAFNIRRAGDRAVVTVNHGTVDVYRANATDASIAAVPTGDSVRVSAGNEVRWDAQAARATVASVDPARALSWREGRLEYINEPLFAVIADINRYAEREVIIRDSAAAELEFTGTVFVASVDEWLRALPGEFPVELASGPDATMIRTRVAASERESRGALPHP